MSSLARNRRILVTAAVVAGLLGVSTAALASQRDGHRADAPAPAARAAAPAKSTNAQPPPAAPVPAKAAPATRGHSAPVAEAKRARAKRNGPLLDMRTVHVENGAPVTLPAVAGSKCPPATLKFDHNLRTTVNGVEYSIYGEGSFAFGDLTGDKHGEQALVITCQGRDQVLVVLGATGPKTYATVASTRVRGTHVDAIRIKDGALTTYDVYYPVEYSDEVHTYRIKGGVLTEVRTPRPPSIRTVQWKNTRLSVPAVKPCMAEETVFKNGVTPGNPSAGDPVWRMLPGGSQPYYADLNGDGRQDALVRMACSVGHPSSDNVVAYRMAAGGRPKLMGVVTSAFPDGLESISSYRAANGVVTAVVKINDPQSGKPREEVRRYRWNGERFVKLS
jgi:hypothetical protein